MREALGLPLKNMSDFVDFIQKITLPHSREDDPIGYAYATDNRQRLVSIRRHNHVYVTVKAEDSGKVDYG